MNTSDIEILVQAIERHQKERPQDRTFKLLSPQGQILWIKTPSQPRLRLLYSVTNRLMSWLGMPYFQAPPHAGAPGGEASLKIESSMLKHLKAADLPVPEIIASTDKWLALSSVGEVNLDIELKNLSSDQRLLLWQQAVIAITEVHTKNCCLSQCFARNIMLDRPDDTSRNSQNISFYAFYFLDFEEDPTQIMSLAQAQARDWALFLHSTAILISSDKNQAQEFMLKQLKKETINTQRATGQIFKKLKVLRHLKTMQWLGRDSIRIYHLGSFAESIYKKLSTDTSDCQ